MRHKKLPGRAVAQGYSSSSSMWFGMWKIPGSVSNFPSAESAGGRGWERLERADPLETRESEQEAFRSRPLLVRGGGGRSCHTAATLPLFSLHSGAAPHCLLFA